MLVTNINDAVSGILKSEEMSKEELSSVMKVSPSSLSRMLHNDILTRQLMDGLDAIGYDVELRLVKRTERGKAVDE